MRAGEYRHDAGAIGALEPLDLVRGDVERFLPGDAHVARLSAVLRVARAGRVEIDPLHRVEEAVGRIDDRLGVLPMRRQRGLARRGELEAPGLDGPGPRVLVVEVDR